MALLGEPGRGLPSEELADMFVTTAQDGGSRRETGMRSAAADCRQPALPASSAALAADSVMRSAS
jgi:hypothetical protein